LRRELPDHIGVSVLCPGVVDTEFWNAARNRPTEHGGPADPNDIAKQIMSQGMDPLEIGRRAVAGVERESFYIVTHPHARSFAEARWNEIEQAFADMAPPTADMEAYDVSRMLEEIFKDFIN
jgi:short-subunit dehydrogenase